MGQAWWSTKWGERWLSSVLVGFDHSALLGGWGLRANLLQSRVNVAAEAELGFAWGAFSIPLSVTLSQRVAAYCSPRVGNWGPEVTGFLPCGVSGELWDGFVLRGEAELSWADFQYYNRRLHLGLAVVQQW